MKPAERSSARLAVVQALYQMEVAGKGVNEIYAEFETHWMGREVEGEQYKPAETSFFRDVLQGVLTGDIQMYLDLYGTLEAQIKAGRLRPIVVLGQKRRANMPDVPTLSETYPGMEVTAWTAYVAPLGTPKEITDKLSSEIAAVMRMPEIRQKFSELGAEAGGISGNDLSQFILREYEKWGKVTVAAGMRPQ